MDPGPILARLWIMNACISCMHTMKWGCSLSHCSHQMLINYFVLCSLKLPLSSGPWSKWSTWSTSPQVRNPCHRPIDRSSSEVCIFDWSLHTSAYTKETRLQNVNASAPKTGQGKLLKKKKTQYKKPIGIDHHLVVCRSARRRMIIKSKEPNRRHRDRSPTTIIISPVFAGILFQRDIYLRSDRSDRRIAGSTHN